MKYELYEAKDDKGREIILNLMQLFTYELSFFEDETTDFKMLDNGLFAINNYIELYWVEEQRHPYILMCNGEIAGFALERYNERNNNEIGAFFVLNKYRRYGAERYMANEIFKLFDGKWEIRTLVKNIRAQDFWRNVVNEFSHGEYNEFLNENNRRVFTF